MSISPIITFKAGKCDIDTSQRPYKVTPVSTPGYIYLYSEEDLVHFCWRERSKALTDEDNLDLVMFPSDGHFEPYEYRTTDQPTSRTNGRIFVLKFSSSSQRHLFWLQSKPQAKNGDASWFSPRDLKIGHIVDALLQGEEIDVGEEIAHIQSGQSGGDDDETMEDAEPHEHESQGASGGSTDEHPTGGNASHDAAGFHQRGLGGDQVVGANPTDAATVVQNFLNSLQGGQSMSQHVAQAPVHTTLVDLLPASTTISFLESASSKQIDSLLRCLPPIALLSEQDSATPLVGKTEPTPDTINAIIDAMSSGQKKSVLRRVLRSPQFHQSLVSLSVALLSGGLPSIVDALGINAGNDFQRGVPQGRDGVEAFLDAMKAFVERNPQD